MVTWTAFAILAMFYFVINSLECFPKEVVIFQISSHLWCIFAIIQGGHKQFYEISRGAPLKSWRKEKVVGMSLLRRCIPIWNGLCTVQPPSFHYFMLRHTAKSCFITFTDVAFFSKLFELSTQIIWKEKGCIYCVYCDNSCPALNLCALFQLDAVSSDAFRVADEKSNFGLFHLLRCLRQLRAGHCFNRPIIEGSPPMLLNSLPAHHREVGIFRYLPTNFVSSFNLWQFF